MGVQDRGRQGVQLKFHFTRVLLVFYCGYRMKESWKVDELTGVLCLPLKQEIQMHVTA